MVEVERKGIILRKTNLEFENEGVLNPAVIFHNKAIHLFYRAVRTGNHSTIGYCRLSDPMTISERYTHPVIVPENDYEIQGVEDPRIVNIDDLFYITYTAYDGFNALGALATTTDFKIFSKAGIIVPQINYKDFSRLVKMSGKLNSKYFRFDQSNMILWDKNVVFFPRKINDQFVFLHRIRPGIQIVAINGIEDLTIEFWNSYFMDFANNILLDPVYDHETSYIGGGCPPIETEQGWLLIYHAVKDTIGGYVYSASAALLDLENPKKEIARLPYPLFGPEKEWEIAGEVNNVCFPTGAVVINDIVYIYYGAADERIACASIALPQLLKELLNNRRTNEKSNHIHDSR